EGRAAARGRGARNGRPGLGGAGWTRPGRARGEPLPDGPGRRDPRTGAPVEDRYSLKWLPDRDRHDHVIEQQFRGGVVPYFYACQFRRGLLAHAALTHKESRGERHVARLWEKAPPDGLSPGGFSPHPGGKS